MAESDYDIKIKLATSYDGAGEQAAAEGLQEVRRAAAEATQGSGGAGAEGVQAVADALREQAQAAAEATQAVTDVQRVQAQVAAATERAAAANRKAAAAAEEAAEAERMLRREMELASKTRLQLSQELGQLEKALRAAAKAGDAAGYQRLRAEMAEVKGAYEKVQSGCEMANVALTQQAQVGLQAGQTMAAIGQAAAGGAGNVAGMASQVISLGAAFKAGLGPIGWAMAALQGLQVAWDYFTQRQEKARKAMEEARRAQEELNKTLLGAATAARGAIADAWRGAAEEEVEAVERAGQQRLAVLEREQTAAQQRSEAMLERLRVETEAEVAAAEAQAAAGLMTAEQLEGARTAARERMRAAEESAAAEADARAQRRLRVEREVNEAVAAERQQLVAELREEFGAHLTWEWSAQYEKRYAELRAQVEGHRAVAEAEQKVIETLNKRLEAEKAGADDAAVLAGLREERARAEARRAEAEAALREVDEQVEFEFKGLLDDARRLSGARAATGMAALELARETREVYEAELRRSEDAAAAVEAGKEAAAELRRTAELRAQQNGALAEAEETERAAAAVRAEVARKEEEWAELQRGSLAEKRRWLEAEVAGMKEGSERRAEYERRLQGVNEEIAAARVHELSTISASRGYEVRDGRSAQERLDADEQILVAKRETLKAELAAGENLTPVLRMNLGRQIAAVERQLEGLAQARLDEELSGLATVYKVTGNYAAKDSRTQEEIYAADRAALEARQAALEQLRQQPGLDAATQKQINEKLAETRGQLVGLEAAMAASAEQAQQMLAGLKPLGQQAKQSNWAHALKRSEQAFLNMAKKAERQAAAGDAAGLERSLAAMGRYAAQQERLTGHTGRAAKHAQEVERNLRAVAAQGDGQEKAQRRQTRAASRAAAAKEKEARAAEKSARAAEADDKQQEGAAAPDVVGLTAQMEAARQALATQQQEVARLRGAVEALAKVTAEVANAARQTAAVAAEGARSAQSALTGQKRELSELRRAVEMLKKL